MNITMLAVRKGKVNRLLETSHFLGEFSPLISDDLLSSYRKEECGGKSSRLTYGSD